jgi:hypothetical protein
MSRKPSIKKMEGLLDNTIGVTKMDTDVYDVDGEIYSTQEAYDIVTGREPEQSKPQKREAVRTPYYVEETILGIAQYMSSSMKVMARWGDTEVNLKSLISAVTSAYASDEFTQVTETMVKNVVNKWKRQGIVEQTTKGHFRSSETSRFDWSQFKRQAN